MGLELGMGSWYGPLIGVGDGILGMGRMGMEFMVRSWMGMEWLVWPRLGGYYGNGWGYYGHYMETMFPTITVPEEMDTYNNGGGRTSNRSNTPRPSFDTRNNTHDHTTLHQDLKTQHQDPKMQHLEKALIPQEPTHNHLEHQHLEIIALLQEVALLITKKFFRREVLVAEFSERRSFWQAWRREEAEEVN